MKLSTPAELASYLHLDINAATGLCRGDQVPLNERLLLDPQRRFRGTRLARYTISVRRHSLPKHGDGSMGFSLSTTEVTYAGNTTTIYPSDMDDETRALVGARRLSEDNHYLVIHDLHGKPLRGDEALLNDPRWSCVPVDDEFAPHFQITFTRKVPQVDLARPVSGARIVTDCGNFISPVMRFPIGLTTWRARVSEACSKMLIRDAADLGHLLECYPSEASIGRRIYKATDCGATFRFLEETSVQEVSHWDVLIKDTEKGLLIHQVWKWTESPPDESDDTTQRQELLDRSVPAAVWDFLHAKKVAGQYYADIKSLDAIQEKFVIERDDDCVLIRKLIRVNYPLPDSMTRVVGCAVGGYVEGTDVQSPSMDLIFPFTAAEFWECLQSADDEAEKIWDQTHGCPGCNNPNYDEDEDEDCGQRAVDPNCTVCGGHGWAI